MNDSFIYEKIPHSREKRAGGRIAKGVKNIHIGNAIFDGVDNAIVFEGDAENVHIGSIKIKNGESPFFMNSMVNSSINNVTVENSEVLNRERENFHKNISTEKDPSIRAVIMGNHAMFLKAHLIFEEALELLIKSLDIFKRQKDEESISMSYTNIGVIFKSLGFYDKAMKSYKLSLIISNKIGMVSGTISNYMNIGIIHDLQGNSLQAIKEYEKCIPLSSGECSYLRGKVYANLALAYTEIDRDKSIGFHKNSIDFNISNNNYYDLAFDYRNLGVLYKNMGKIGLSTTCLTKASEIFHTLGNYREESRTKKHLSVAFNN